MNLDIIRQNLESQDEEIQQHAWTSLYEEQSPEAIDEINRIITSTDPILKILLCRFLSRLENERSSRYLVALLSDSNEAVVERAILAFDKNRYSDKVKRLLGVLESPSIKARLYAIDKLCSNRVSECTLPLLKILRSRDEKTFIAVLMGVRLLGDKRIFNDVLALLDDENENIRFHAVLALGSIYSGMRRKISKLLYPRISDSSARVRKAILWIFKKDRKRKVKNLFFELSLRDSSADVRQEAISCLASRPSYKVVKHLVNILNQSYDRNVMLLAEATLLGFPVKHLSSYLKRMLADDDSEIRYRVLTLYSSLKKGQEDCYLFLLREWEKRKGEKETIHLMECMGFQGDERFIPLLEALLKDSPLVGYVASSVLCKIWGNSSQCPLLNYLRQVANYESSIQVFLKHAYKTGFIPHGELKDHIISLIHHPILNVRYLSLQLLKLNHDSSLFLELIDVYKNESDETIQNVIAEMLHSILVDDPHKTGLVFGLLTDEVLIEQVFGIIIDFKLSKESIFVFTSCLLRLNDNPIFMKGLFKLLLSSMQQNIFVLNELLEKFKDRSMIIFTLMYIQEKVYAGHDLYFDLSEDIIRKIEDMDYPEDMHVLILSLGCGVKPASLSHLVDISCSIQHARHAPLCAKAIRFFMQRERQVA